MKKYNGYTLVEILISLAVGMIILTAIYSTVDMGQRSTVNIERRVAAHQDVRAALEMMSLEIQMASYNPRPDYENGAFWITSGSCTTSINQSYKGIQLATGSSITVEMNIDGSNGIGDNPNEVITYSYDSTKQYITRSTDCASGNHPFLGDIPGNPRAVRVINTAAVPVFRYFDAKGIEITVSSLPAGIPNIARIDITLWVETENVDQNSGQRKRLVYSTSVIPRNHVISK